MAAVFCLLMTLSQLLLYMSSGMLNVNAAHYGRYVLPGIVGYAFLLAEVIQLIQRLTDNNRAIVALIAVMLTVSIGDKSVTAYQEAVASADVSWVIDNMFDSIENNTERDDPIVLAFINGVPNSYSLQVALRVYYILSRRHDQANVYYSLIPPNPTLEEARLQLFQADSRRHAMNMRSVEHMDESRPPTAIVIINWGREPGVNEPISFSLERWLRHKKLEWFDPQKYRRKVHRNGYITYFRDD